MVIGVFLQNDQIFSLKSNRTTRITYETHFTLYENDKNVEKIIVKARHLWKQLLRTQTESQGKMMMTPLYK
jgi:hypothetical protein